MPGWLKWALVLAFGFLFLVVAFVVSVADKPAEITSWDQWVKHRDYIKSLSANVMISKDALTVYAKANDYYKDPFYNSCALGACSEYKAYIRAARDASVDGRLTPEELTNIAEYQVRLNSKLSDLEKEYGKKFKK